MTVNTALIGYGFAGKTFHAPLLQATPGVALTHVMTGHPEKVRADLPGVATCASLAEVLAFHEVDLVVIATPDALHASQAIAALEAGKHVVVDKPFAPTLAEAEAMAACAEKHGRLLSVFHNRRWDGDFLTVRRLIADGSLGEVVQFESHFDRFRPVVADRWREKPGAGVWQDLGPHLVDQALQAFGMPIAVYADMARQKDGALIEDYFHVLLRYERLRVILHASQMTSAGDLRFAVHGTGGSFVKYGLDVQEGQLKAGLRPGDAGWGADARAATFTSAGGEVQAVGVEAGAYQDYYAGVRDAIVSGAPLPVTAGQALDVMRVLALGHRSYAEQREVAVE